MSYSFTFQAADKAQAKEKAAAEFDKVVSSQPLHARDRDPVLAAVSAFVDLIADDESKDIYVSVSGSVGWQSTLAPGGEATLPLSAASVAVAAYHTQREAQPA